MGMSATMKVIAGGAGAVVAGAVEPYGLTSEFERALIYFCCTDRDVYARIGPHLDAKALNDKIGTLLFKAAQSIASDTGEGPSSAVSVIQRLRSWREDGKVSYEQVQEALAYLDDAEDAGLPDEEEVINEMATLIKKRAKREKAKKVLDVVAKGGDFAKLGNEMAAVERIGEGRATIGDMLAVGSVDNIMAAASLGKFSTGCTELDYVLGGGLPKGFTLFLGREKSGKSMVLSSIAADAVWNGKNVALATLELDTNTQMARVIANLTSTTIDEVEAGHPQVKPRLTMLQKQMGKLACQKFSPDTPVAEIIRWREKVAEAWGHKVDLLVVDYVDLVGAGKEGAEDAYSGQRVVINEFRDDALRENYIVISASQAKRGSGTNNKQIDTDDASDSQNKIRIPDLVVAMRMEPDNKDYIDWYVIVSRKGKDRVGTGELPANRAMGRMYPTVRMEPW